MDDSEYYAMMRHQYSNPIKIKKTRQQDKNHTDMDRSKTAGTFSQWAKDYGHEDAEMFLERNQENSDE